MISGRISPSDLTPKICIDMKHLISLVLMMASMISVQAAPAKPLGASLPKGLIKAALPARTELPKVIEITKGNVAPTPIAIPEFGGDSEFSKKITDVIKNDLNMCGRFKIIGPESFIQDQHSVLENVRFADWRGINSQILVTGKVFEEGGKLKVEFRIFDVFKGTMMVGLSLNADEDKWRKLAHMVSDAIFERVTGDAGFFDSQIVFIDEKGSVKSRKKRLAVMDFDGHNPKMLTDGEHLVLTPRFSPSTHHIAYLAYRKEKKGMSAGVYLMDVQKHTTKHLGDFQGMTFAPRFSPDGSTVVMSLSKGGTTAIYTYNIHTKEKHQLTQHAQIDTSPCYSPDGKYIVFTSDRGGGVEKIWMMNADGTGAHQISKGPGKYSQPVWSPRGDLITFSKREGGDFCLGVMDIDGANERLIDKAYMIEGVSWSPNGRYILYTKETHLGGGRVKSKLYCTDMTGLLRVDLKTPNDASDPTWSPLLSSITVRGKKDGAEAAAAA